MVHVINKGGAMCHVGVCFLWFHTCTRQLCFSNSEGGQIPPPPPQMKPWGVFQATSNYPQRLLYLLHSTLWLSCHDVLTQLSPLPTNAARSLPQLHMAFLTAVSHCMYAVLLYVLLLPRPHHAGIASLPVPTPH